MLVELSNYTNTSIPYLVGVEWSRLVTMYAAYRLSSQR